MSLFNQPRALSWLSISFDRTLDVEDVHRLVLSIVSTTSLKTVVFEAEPRDGATDFRVGTSKPQHMKSLLETFLSGTTVQPMRRPSLPTNGSAWAVQASTNRRSLEVSEHEAVTQRLLGALAVDGALHQIVIARRLRPMAVPVAAEGLRSESWHRAALEAAIAGSRRYDGELRRAMAAKQAEAGAQITMRLIVPGARELGVRVLPGYSAAVRSLEAPGLRLRLKPDSWAKARAGRSGGKQIVLNATELTAVLGWPFGERSYEGLDRAGSRLLPAVTTSGSRIIGQGVHPASRIDVGVSVVDGLRHMRTMGPTGVGKSTLLEKMALQDIEGGRGVIVIDPKGDLVDGILSRVRHAELRRIVVLDAARRDHLVGFNPLSVPPAETELAVDGILHVLRSLNADSWGPRTQDILHAGLLTLARSAQPTLVALPELLLDERFRRAHVGGEMSPALRSFWAWYEALSDAERSSVIAPVLNKVRPFTMRSSLRAMLGQTRPLFDMKTTFTERKVLLVPLRKGEIGSDTAKLVGSLIFARLWQLAQGRSAIAADRRHAVFAYLDEFQEYLRLPTDFTDVLTQARGLGLGLVLAHQHLRQLGPDVRAAVSANAQTSVMFRLGDEDANVIARPVSQLEPVDFSSLRAYSAYADVLVNGQRSGYASIKTLPPRKQRRAVEPVTKSIAKRWGVEPAAVDAQLYGQDSGDPDAPIGVKKRGPS